MPNLTWGTIDYYISRLNSTENNPPLRIDVCNQNLTDSDAIRLADALLHCKNGSGSSCGSTLKKLRLRGNDISSTGFLAICEAIGGVDDSTAALEELDMGNNRVVSNVDDFTFAIYLLFAAAPNLKHVDLTGNKIGLSNDGDMKFIGEMLSLIEKYGGRLETLNLSDNCLCDRAIVNLSKTLSTLKSVTRLDLSSNFIGVTGAKALADAIALNLPLQQLHLKFNFIGDAGAKVFASALKTNDTLLELNLGCNRITAAGMKDLQTSVYDTTTLNSLVASNHTVSIFLHERCAGANDIDSLKCTEEQLFETKQILRINEIRKHNPNFPSVHRLKLAAHLGQNFDMKYFQNIDRKHMPEVLKFIHDHFGVEKMFAIIKEMPLSVCAK